MADEKQVVVETTPSGQTTISDEKIVVQTGDEPVQTPVVKSFSVFRVADDIREVRDSTTGKLSYKVGLEIKNHILRPKEHMVTLTPKSGDKASSSASAKVNAKSGDIQISSGAETPWQPLERQDIKHTFSAVGRQLLWEPSSMGIDLGQFKLLDANTQQSLAVWKTEVSIPGQSAKIDFFSTTDPHAEALSLAAIFGILESMHIAANRDDDHGGGSRKFAGVDPGNSMDMGAGAGML
ncbi:hypothetical protein M409DRAFT_54956 [Zasmidium cellare ATCC 36951]|uniref:Uncharacterized protein n=1 Tax=Zasmidium cellare ATCC 36951 TaxID=1080233 RepID=A0A6A6CK95_ZASCE|nr:uncharacterized protein M409DRAFT_54956 [Zasmidium cellare ATCC 36951]KAF2166628.1 hypothetical protein M409DRAFT_54956 [Zasmidium cellare ATCC 36951]